MSNCVECGQPFLATCRIAGHHFVAPAPQPPADAAIEQRLNEACASIRTFGQINDSPLVTGDGDAAVITEIVERLSGVDWDPLNFGPTVIKVAHLCFAAGKRKATSAFSEGLTCDAADTGLCGHRLCEDVLAIAIRAGGGR